MRLCYDLSGYNNKMAQVSQALQKLMLHQKYI